MPVARVHTHSWQVSVTYTTVRLDHGTVQHKMVTRMIRDSQHIGIDHSHDVGCSTTEQEERNRDHLEMQLGPISNLQPFFGAADQRRGRTKVRGFYKLEKIRQVEAPTGLSPGHLDEELLPCIKFSAFGDHEHLVCMLLIKCLLRQR